MNKELEALEIIKNKISLVKFTNKDSDTYYLNCEEELTQEEYELLKEVLL